MGCCGSAPAARNDPSSSAESSGTGGDVTANKGLMHTNSMLFPKDAIEEAKKSVRLQKPINEDGLALLPEDDPDGVFVSADPMYELGMEIEYPAEMSDTLSLSLYSKLPKNLKPGAKASKNRKAPAAPAEDGEGEGASASAPAGANDNVSDDGDEDEELDPETEFEPLLKLVFGYKSIQGRSAVPPSKPNQDSVVAFRVEGKPNQAVFGIFDGHGPFGEHASHFCRMELHKTIKRVYAEHGDDLAPESVLDETIRIIHEAFINTDPSYSGVDPQVSGTTLIVAMVVDHRVYVANVGDSRCILGEKIEGESRGKVKEMSDDHKPERDSERKRIEATEAVLMSEGQLRGGRKEGKTYICRRRNGDIIYGVLFTRSVGDADAHEHLGVSAEPEFKQTKIRKDIVQYLVLASDGVWDQMTNEQVLSKVFQIKDPLTAAEQIAYISRDLWDNDRLHSRRDDITVCVVQLN